MDYANERWLKVYTRNTGGWLDLSWQARGLSLEITRHLDAAGQLPLGKRGLPALAGVLRGRWEDMEPFVNELLEDDRLVLLDGNVLLDPGHVARQEARSSASVRKKVQRDRESLSRDVTRRHAASRDVTPSHDQKRSEEIRSEEIPPNPPQGEPTPSAPVDEPTGIRPSKFRYREAYCAGIARGKGSPFAWPSGKGEQFADEELGKAILTFAKSRSTGKAIRGDDLIGWISAAAEDFASAVAEGARTGTDDPKYWSNYGPKGLVRFLNQDSMAEEARNVG